MSNLNSDTIALLGGMSLMLFSIFGLHMRVVSRIGKMADRVTVLETQIKYLVNGANKNES